MSAFLRKYPLCFSGNVEKLEQHIKVGCESEQSKQMRVDIDQNSSDSLCVKTDAESENLDKETITHIYIKKETENLEAGLDCAETTTRASEQTIIWNGLSNTLELPIEYNDINSVPANEENFNKPENDPLEGVDIINVNSVDSATEFKLEETEDGLRYKCSKCDFTTRLKVNIKKHFANKHDANVQWHKCPLCDYKVKKKYNLETHMRNRHGENVEWHLCDLCDYRSKQKCTLTRHYIDKHESNVNWHNCQLCPFKTKRKSNLKLHFTNKHTDIFVWHQCPKCETRFKRKSVLVKHLRREHKCDIK